MYLTPGWDPQAPDELARIVEKYKVSGEVLAAQGYAIEDASVAYWFMRVWDRQSETWYLPWQVGTSDEPVIDESRTVRHALGFVPMVWVRNLPGGDDTDGACTFRAAIETAIEIDYQLSQAGRGLEILLRSHAAHQGAGGHGRRDRARRGQCARRFREGRCAAAGDRRHGGVGGDRVCAHAARIHARERARQSRRCVAARRRDQRARARTDEPGARLARRQSARLVWRGRAARACAHGAAGVASAIR